jgi:protein-L-isoaspartate(D-aspartate) O-methyltransferase
MSDFNAQGSRAGEMLDRERHRMVETQIEGRQITNPAVLRAMRRVPRHAFVPTSLWGQAYRDGALPIGHGQTISQPYIVAYMTDALSVHHGHKVLEVGCGSGYQAAVLADMGVEVHSVEIIPALKNLAAQTLTRLGYPVHTHLADGTFGWPDAAPYDGIIVTAAPQAVPVPLFEQLRENGRLVIPVGPASDQRLNVFQKRAGQLKQTDTLAVRFVPMTGKIQEH